MSSSPSQDVGTSVSKMDNVTEHIRYSELSKMLTNQLSKQEKKEGGVYFTPPKTIHDNLTSLMPYLSNISSILEPSCGSCEYLLALQKHFSDIPITGIELNTTIYQEIKGLENDRTTIHQGDYLTFHHQKTYDLIIGNPPYFVMKKKQVDNSYYNYFIGRPNIFILFIIKSLKLLNDRGILSFVLPKNFLNCHYYDKTRHHIAKQCKILAIHDCDSSYLETKQDTIIMNVQKLQPDQRLTNQAYILPYEHYTIFGTPSNIANLTSLTNGSHTLSQLDFKASVGTVVWNQCKDILTDDTTKTRLIYSSDIKGDVLGKQSYTNPEKKNYINKPGESGPLLVVNRGYGVGQYQFQYCLINQDNLGHYLVENHLMCLRPTKPISEELLIKKYEMIINSLQDSRTGQFIKLYFGNSAINTTEFSEILPFYTS